MYYYMEIWGCQMNEHDSEILAGLLEKCGYDKTDDVSEANLIILYTCCVREKAEQKVLGHLGSLKKYKTKNPNLIIAMGGCMAQQPEMSEYIRTRAPHIDLIFGTHNIHRLPQLIQEAKDSNSTLIEVWDKEQEIVEQLPMKRSDNLKAYTTIMYGCNNFCTYCIVPYVRGRERSRNPEEIKKEIQDLMAEGCKEVMLLGQNVNSYGKDLSDKVDFSDLLELLDPIADGLRIRYMTPHPRDFTDKLIDTIANSKNICHHFHLPVQSGSTNILKKMHRGYTKEQYLNLVQKIKDRFPKAALTTDIIVGFPGETEEDFEHTLDVVKQAKYDQAYTFIYSPRKGTPAAEMTEQIPPEIKKARFQRLLDLQNEISLEINKKLIGKTEKVLVEGLSKNDNTKLTGRTDGNKIVIFEGTEDLIGKIIPIKINTAQTWVLFGDIEKASL